MNIKNFIISAIISSAACFSGCKQSEFDYKMVEVSAQDVSSIYFSTGSDKLIADGKASLKFVVETYKDYKKSDGSVVKQLFDYRDLPAGTVKIFEETTNKEVGLTYSNATAVEGSKLRFYAQVGNIKSPVKEVTIRATPPVLPKLYVDVIFHVWELNPTNVAYDLSSFQPTNYDDIVKGIKIMNDIINNKVGNAPNAAAANIEFRLATKNVAGQTLQFPGYDRIVYSDEIKAVPTAPTIGLGDFSDYINKNTAKFIWSPKTYLNINIIPSGSNNSLGNLFPAKQLTPGPGEILIPGVAGIAANVDDFVTSFQATTVFMPNTVFRPGYERRIEIFNSIGAFYGLYSTTSYTTARFHSDYCEDTPQFSSDFAFTIQTGINGEKFVIENAMDDNRYPSNRSSITLDQVNRMRSVMLRCPGRMNSKTQ
ncbi:M43 family zinc metalloprotease [Pedobacter nyackensis]|uniref:Pregnancy-associated plasma protein-A n=1 Tax=Pedobacter nyackensis TaxID=475255 RepID=A0A1W2B0P6_9SPHI|nr:M43 family zinc metalloprotease [Pedobacter nyackensis]SMC66444.1 Pregnancy-associated plasma protein-A [Pedobacter nyackensis]